jgi:hypothetical protein
MGRKRKPNKKDVVFKRIIGVKPETFAKMKEILQKEYEQLHKLGGKPPKLSVEDKLKIALMYYREYRTMEHIGHDYNVCKSTICDSIQWVENTLEKDGTFALPGKETLQEPCGASEYGMIDVTESPIQRPKKPKRLLFRQKEAPYSKNPGDCQNQGEEKRDHRCL